MENTRKPDHDIRLGTIQASIWFNENKDGDQYTVTVSRLYKKDDKWQRAATFRPMELPLLSEVVKAAQNWIYEHKQS